jgi:hypothetical protein
MVGKPHWNCWPPQARQENGSLVAGLYLRNPEEGSLSALCVPYRVPSPHRAVPGTSLTRQVGCPAQCHTEDRMKSWALNPGDLASE